MKSEKKSQTSKGQTKLAKTIETLEKIANENRTPAENLTLALALLKSAQGKWSERDQIRQAVGILKGMRSFIEAKIGEGCFDLDQWAMANDYLEQARKNRTVDSQVDMEHLFDLMDECEDNLTYPHFQETFELRVPPVWESFEELIPQILDDLQLLSADEDGVKSINIRSVFTDVLALESSCWLTEEGEKLKLGFYPAWSLLRCHELLYLKQHAPKTVTDKFDFEIGFKPSTDKFMGMRLKGDGGKPVEPDFDINKISLQVTELDHQFQIFAYCEDWEPFLEHAYVWEDEEAVVKDLTKTFLGTIAFNKYVDSVVIVDKPFKEGAITADKLPQLFADKGIDIHAPLETMLNSIVTYSHTPEWQPEDKWPRDDIVSGKTMCKKLLDEYEDENTEDIDLVEADGTTVGYLYYPIDSFKGSNVKKDRDQFRESLIKGLQEKAGPDSVKIIGEAIGEQYDYVDFIAWDLAVVLNVAQKILEQLPAERTYYQVFRKSADSLILTNKKSKDTDTVKAEKS